MWRETDLAGVLVSPFLAYVAAAFVLWLPVRFAFDHFRLDRLVLNAPLAEAAVFVGILGALVVLL